MSNLQQLDVQSTTNACVSTSVTSPPTDSTNTGQPAGTSTHNATAGVSAKRHASFPTIRTAFRHFVADQEEVVDEIIVQRSPSNVLASLTLFITKTYKTCDPKFKPIQTLPQRVLTVPSEPVLNNGKDNQDSNLICRVHDRLGSGDRSFTILDLLGTGTFGQVFRCKKDDTKELVAVKVIKNKPAYHNQGKLEIKIAQLLNTQYDPRNDKHIVRLLDYFEHHGHICLVFELLNMSLLDLLTQNQFRGLPLSLVQKYTKQILTALVVLEDAGIIHCDLKPENILLQPFNPPKQKRVSKSTVTNSVSTLENNSSISSTESTSVPPQQKQPSHQESQGTSRRSTAHMSDVKVIDFGSACFEGRTIYSYIQSRFYRSPEVLLGCPYTGAIDMWSLACVCAEMYLGLPLFPGVSQHNQLSRIVEMFGNPPDFLIECKNGSKFFAAVPLTEESSAPANTGAKPAFHSAPSSTKYRIKTPEEYAAETKTEVPVLKKYLKYNVLDEVILKCFPAHKLRLTPEQKNIEINRRKCFVDFLYGLFRLNPFERWSAKQAMEHPFIKNTPFTVPFVPPQDLKLQERKLSFMVQLQQRSSSASSTATTVVSTSSVVAATNTTDPNAAALQGQRVPTNFGSNMASTQHGFTPMQYSQRRLSDPALDHSTVAAAVSANIGSGTNAPLSISLSSGQTVASTESSPVSPQKNNFDSDERPTLKRGAPVHLKSAAVAPTVSENTGVTTLSTDNFVATDVSVGQQPEDINEITSYQIASSIAVAAGISDSKAPKPTGNIGRHKPRASFTSRVEQHMLKPHDSSSSTGTGAMPTQLQQQPAVVSHGLGSIGGVSFSGATTSQYLSQSLHVPSDPGQFMHENRKHPHHQSSHLQTVSQQQPSTKSHHHAASWNPFSSSPIHQQVNNPSSGTGFTSASIGGSVYQAGTLQYPVQQQQQQQQHQIASSWHPSHQMSNQHGNQATTTSSSYYNPGQGSNLMPPSISFAQQQSLQQQHFMPPPPGPDFYVGSISGHSTSYGGSLGVFAAGSMQEGGHAMTDFGMALLRPDMDEQRRLLSQQSVNSSSGYWPGHISSYIQFGNDQQSPQLYPNSSYGYGHNGTASASSGMAMSYDSTTFLQHQQLQMQQQQQHQAMMGRQPPINYPPIQIRKDALSNLSPRTSRKSEVPMIGSMRMRSHSQDSVGGEPSPRSGVAAPVINAVRANDMDGSQISPTSRSTSTSRFFGGSDSMENPSVLEPTSPMKDSPNKVLDSGSSTPVGPKSSSSRNSGKKQRRGSSDSTTGKVADSLAEWDPFFESDDI